MNTVWIVLFRGVGGKTQLPVKRLQDALTAGGFENVVTYINSGNAVLRSSLPSAEVARHVADICFREFGFDKDVHVRSLAEWRELIANNPFPEAVSVPKFLHAAVLGDVPEEGRVETLRGHASNNERIAVIGTVAYLHTPNGFGTSRLAEKFDRGIGVVNTARNWNTVIRLEELARDAAGDA